MVAHLRKKGSNEKRRLPSLDDFHGSSNIFKIAHTVILVSPNYQGYDIENQLYPTFFYTPKSRAGASTNRVAIKTFNGKEKKYNDGYDLADYKTNKSGEWELEEKEKDGINNF